MHNSPTISLTSQGYGVKQKEETREVAQIANNSIV